MKLWSKVSSLSVGSVRRLRGFRQVAQVDEHGHGGWNAASSLCLVSPVLLGPLLPARFGAPAREASLATSARSRGDDEHAV